MSLYDDKEVSTTGYGESRTPSWLAGVAVVALLVALAGLIWSFTLQSRLQDTQARLANSAQQNAALSDKIDDANERMKAQGEALAQSVGLTQKQLEDKANLLVIAQKKARAQTAQLAREQKDTEQKVGAVQNDVSSVKTDVGGVKTDVASTQADLAATKTQLTSVIGDQGVMSGLIATNKSQLEELKHRGDRNYYEFTLRKGAPAENVGTIKLSLRKVDLKRSKFTLLVSSDDKLIEKKDRTLDEPIQFYSGKNPAMFEVVVNGIGKKTVTGYLSTPKNAPAPMPAPAPAA